MQHDKQRQQQQPSPKCFDPSVPSSSSSSSSSSPLNVLLLGCNSTETNWMHRNIFSPSSSTVSASSSSSPSSASCVQLHPYFMFQRVPVFSSVTTNVIVVGNEVLAVVGGGGSEGKNKKNDSTSTSKPNSNRLYQLRQLFAALDFSLSFVVTVDFFVALHRHIMTAATSSSVVKSADSSIKKKLNSHDGGGGDNKVYDDEKDDDEDGRFTHQYAQLSQWIDAIYFLLWSSSSSTLSGSVGSTRLFPPQVEKELLDCRVKFSSSKDAAKSGVVKKALQKVEPTPTTVSDAAATTSTTTIIDALTEKAEGTSPFSSFTTNTKEKELKVEMEEEVVGDFVRQHIVARHHHRRRRDLRLKELEKEEEEEDSFLLEDPKFPSELQKHGNLINDESVGAKDDGEGEQKTIEEGAATAASSSSSAKHHHNHHHHHHHHHDLFLGDKSTHRFHTAMQHVALLQRQEFSKQQHHQSIGSLGSGDKENQKVSSPSNNKKDSITPKQYNTNNSSPQAAFHYPPIFSGYHFLVSTQFTSNAKRVITKAIQRYSGTLVEISGDVEHLPSSLCFYLVPHGDQRSSWQRQNHIFSSTSVQLLGRSNNNDGDDANYHQGNNGGSSSSINNHHHKFQNITTDALLVGIMQQQWPLLLTTTTPSPKLIIQSSSQQQQQFPDWFFMHRKFYCFATQLVIADRVPDEIVLKGAAPTLSVDEENVLRRYLLDNNTGGSSSSNSTTNNCSSSGEEAVGVVVNSKEEDISSVFSAAAAAVPAATTTVVVGVKTKGAKKTRTKGSGGSATTSTTTTTSIARQNSPTSPLEPPQPPPQQQRKQQPQSQTLLPLPPYFQKHQNSNNKNNDDSSSSSARSTNTPSESQRQQQVQLHLLAPSPFLSIKRYLKKSSKSVGLHILFSTIYNKGNGVNTIYEDCVRHLGGVVDSVFDVHSTTHVVTDLVATFLPADGSGSSSVNVNVNPSSASASSSYVLSPVIQSALHYATPTTSRTCTKVDDGNVVTADGVGVAAVQQAAENKDGSTITTKGISGNSSSDSIVLVNLDWLAVSCFVGYFVQEEGFSLV